MEEMHKARDSLLQSVADLTNEQLNQQPAEDIWSIGQILHHLYLTERLVTNFIHKASSLPDEAVKDMPINYLLNRSVKVKSPVEVEPKQGFIDKTKMLDQLHFSRNTLLQTLDDLSDPSILQRKAIPHPILGKMRLDQWVELIPYHERRHTEQIIEIKKHL